ncbi:unnamed protein product [Allacma fusca]|uniref:C-type lectin domain-containing protein n=1 Tax=Allacma fusca TaxID=39272 RepID=A0A8J2J865_9HEXA|nr:unnamed protein product [Allacma fusca]
MSHKFFLIHILMNVIIVAALPGPMERDETGRNTKGVFYLTNRAYKQLEGFEICRNRRDDFRLAEIDSAKKSEHVKEYLLRHEYTTAWTAGRTGACPFRDYVWGKDDERPINYTNWKKTPAPGDVSEAEWHESGIIVRESPLGKWDLVHRQALHPVLCELYKM